MSDEVLRHVIYKICSAEIIIINVIKQDVVPSSTLLSFLRKDEKGGLMESKKIAIQ